jgi:hypothetical protein
VLVVALATTAVLALGILASRPSPESYDAAIMMQVTESLLDHGDLKVREDAFGQNSPYSNFGLGLSLLMAPVALVADAVNAHRSTAMMLTNPILLAGLAALLMAWARLAEASVRTALKTTAVVIAGTLLLPHTATGFSEIAVAVGVAIGLVGLEATGQARRWAGLVAGTGAGLALLCRTDSLVLVVPFVAAGTWWAGGRSLRALVQFGVAFAPWFVVWAGYNNYRYGAPWELGYEEAGFTAPFLKGLYGLTASSGRGIIWFVPLVFVAAAGIRAAYRRAPVVTLAALGMFVVRFLFFAKWQNWEGGVTWGPRFLVPAMPLLAVGVLEVMRAWRSHPAVVRRLLVGVVSASVAVQLIGVTVAYEVFWNEKVVPRVAGQDPVDVSFHLFHWGHSPILGEARYLFRGHGLASRYLRPDVEVLPVIVLLAFTVAAASAAWRLSRPRARVGEGECATHSA